MNLQDMYEQFAEIANSIPEEMLRGAAMVVARVFLSDYSADEIADNTDEIERALNNAINASCAGLIDMPYVTLDSGVRFQIDGESESADDMSSLLADVVDGKHSAFRPMRG